MAHIIIQHQVDDYASWRPHFDADKGAREAAGARDVAVLQDADDPNSVWMVMEADPSVVEPMMSDPERAAEMQAAGVISQPQVWVAP
jgi:hypothetical protein